MRSTSWNQALRIGLVLLAVSLLAGCYTVLRHPRVETDVHDGAWECASCHADAELYHFRDSFYDYGGTYGYGVTPWYGYYAAPWWYDNYWYYPHDDYEGEPYPSTGDRRLWQRGAPGGPDVPRVGGSSGGETRGKPQGEEERDKEPEKKEKKKRRLWGRGKKD
ncbi:MAG: hypothetical protein GF355_12805 [Candidatus Eisenbacteria bacterium]|nr:hypothetical protein [Candidatus Eisenbacteria bacterium]